MDSIQLLFQGFASVFQPLCLVLMLFGVVFGIVFGSIPGLSAAMAVALFLPVTFSMEPMVGLNMLVAIYIGGISGGLISAILLKIPGTPSSIATCFDGAPMAEKGQAGKALGMGIMVSFIGGLLSFILLTFVSPTLAGVAIKFGPMEYFGVTFFAITMIATVSSGNLVKGLLSGMSGLALASIGLAPIDGIPRFTFGSDQLISGFDTLPTLIGIFAIAEVLSLAESVLVMKGIKKAEMAPMRGIGFKLAELLPEKWNILRSSLIGVGIGILPGIGGSTSGILSYIAAKKSSKNPEKFGQGCVSGLVASETANNATIGGAMIPLLSLGIPGDGVTAMLLGGFMIHGLQPGPLLFTKAPNIVYSIFAACIIANVMMIVVEFLGLRGFVKLLSIPKNILMPIILVLCTVGAFATNSNMFDAKSIIIFGILGYVWSKFEIPVAPFILSFILGKQLELYLRRGLMLTKGDFFAFFGSPIAAVFMIVAIVVVVWTFVKAFRGPKKAKDVKAKNTEANGTEAKVVEKGEVV